MSIDAIAIPRSPAAAAVERWYVLIVMCSVYALNIAARYVVTTVFDPIRLELRLTDAGAAFLTGVPLALFYVTFGIPVAWLSDRSNRRNIVAASLVLWSMFTVFCGLSQSYWQLLTSRIGVGIGEAGATPASTSIVSDCFSAQRRPMALSIFALGAPVGAWLGADLAGAVAQAHGWRAAFFALGVPGVLLGLLVFLTIAEPKRGCLDAVGAEGKPSFGASLRFLWQQRAAFHVIMGSGVCSLWGWGLAWWTPTFLMRTYGLNVAQAGAVTGHIHLVAGILATAAAAWLMSRPFMRDPRRILLVLGLLIGTATLPSIVGYGTHSLWLAKLMFWMFIPAIYFFIGPCMALVLNTAPSNMRSVFTAWSVLVGNVFNLIVAPQAVGLLSDWLAGPGGPDAASLRLALLALAPTGFWASWHFFRAMRTVAPDMKRAIGYVATGLAALSLVVLGPTTSATAASSGAGGAGARVLNPDAHFAEGPVWYHGKLYYVEYDRNSVTTWDGTTNRIFWSKKGCGPSAVIATARGEFLVTCYDSGSIGHIAADGKDLAPYSHDKDGHGFVGPNDFAPDRHGGIYFTCSGTAPGPAIDGKVFYLASDGTITQAATDLHSANGIVVANEGKTLYVIETEDHRLVQFKIAPDASLSDRRVFLNLDDLTGNVTHIYPDGVKIDSKGELYIGQNPRDVHAPLAGTIFVVNTEGKLLRSLKLPSPGVPNLAFSPDEQTVYVMALDQLDKSPYRGKVYSIPSH